MRLYRLPEFLALPPGTIYCVGEPFAFQGPFVKGETLSPCDWLYFAIDGIDADDTGDMFETYRSMLEDGLSFPMDASASRDGEFNRGRVFLVYERDDLLRLRDLVTAAIAITT